MDVFFKSANDILGVFDNLFTEGFLWAPRVTNLFLVSSLELESKFKAMVKAWCYHRPSVHGDQVCQMEMDVLTLMGKPSHTAQPPQAPSQHACNPQPAS